MNIKYVGVGRRAVANSVDLLFTCIIGFIVSIIFEQLYGNAGFNKQAKSLNKYLFYNDLSKRYFLGIAIVSLASALFHSLFISSRLQATPGKWLVNIKVVDKNLLRLRFSRAFYREILIKLAMFILILITFKILAVDYVTDGYKETDRLYNTEISSLMPNFTAELKKNNVTFMEFSLSLGKPEDGYLKPELGKKLIEIFNSDAKNIKEEDKVKTRNFQHEIERLATDTVIKAFCYAILSTILFYLIWYGTIYFTKEKLAVHDIIADTRVIKYLKDKSYI